MLDRHVSYLASKLNFVDEDIGAMMIASRLKKDSYLGLSAPDSARKNITFVTASTSWHELGMLTLLALHTNTKNCLLYLHQIIAKY